MGAAKGQEGRGKPFGDALAAWVRASLRGADGTDRYTHSEVIDKSGIGRATFYRILSGEGGETDQETVTKLATALRVHAPRIVRVLETGDGESDEAASPMELIREAQALLVRAEKRLTASTRDATRAHRLADRHTPVPARRDRPA